MIRKLTATAAIMGILMSSVSHAAINPTSIDESSSRDNIYKLIDKKMEKGQMAGVTGLFAWASVDGEVYSTSIAEIRKAHRGGKFSETFSRIIMEDVMDDRFEMALAEANKKSDEVQMMMTEVFANSKDLEEAQMKIEELKQELAFWNAVGTAESVEQMRAIMNVRTITDLIREYNAIEREDGINQTHVDAAYDKGVADTKADPMWNNEDGHGSTVVLDTTAGTATVTGLAEGTYYISQTIEGGSGLSVAVTDSTITISNASDSTLNGTYAREDGVSQSDVDGVEYTITVDGSPVTIDKDNNGTLTYTTEDGLSYTVGSVDTHKGQTITVSGGAQDGNTFYSIGEDGIHQSHVDDVVYMITVDGASVNVTNTSVLSYTTEDGKSWSVNGTTYTLTQDGQSDVVINTANTGNSTYNYSYNKVSSSNPHTGQIFDEPSANAATQTAYNLGLNDGNGVTGDITVAANVQPSAASNNSFFTVDGGLAYRDGATNQISNYVTNPLDLINGGGVISNSTNTVPVASGLIFDAGALGIFVKSGGTWMTVADAYSDDFIATVFTNDTVDKLAIAIYDAGEAAERALWSDFHIGTTATAGDAKVAKVANTVAIVSFTDTTPQLSPSLTPENYISRQLPNTGGGNLVVAEFTGSTHYYARENGTGSWYKLANEAAYNAIVAAGGWVSSTDFTYYSKGDNGWHPTSTWVSNYETNVGSITSGSISGQNVVSAQDVLNTSNAMMVSASNILIDTQHTQQVILGGFGFNSTAPIKNSNGTWTVNVTSTGHGSGARSGSQTYSADTTRITMKMVALHGLVGNNVTHHYERVPGTDSWTRVNAFTSASAVTLDGTFVKMPTGAPDAGMWVEADGYTASTDLNAEHLGFTGSGGTEKTTFSHRGATIGVQDSIINGIFKTTATNVSELDIDIDTLERSFEKAIGTAYNEGYDDGYTDGYADGFKDGVESVTGTD